VRNIVEECDLPTLGLGFGEVHRALRAGTFPAPTPNVRPGRVCFWRDEIEAWIESAKDSQRAN
jgi:predicted DNA-binding transcriptional regulator AlpA